MAIRSAMAVARFAAAGGLSLIEAIQVEARTKPGPGTYHPTPTFAEELETQEQERAFTAFWVDAHEIDL